MSQTSSSSSIDVDVAVIGAGPGGTASACYLAREGLKVVVFERETFPRFRIGESLLPHNMPIFEELGVAEEMEKRFIRKYGAHFADRTGYRRSRYPFATAIDKSYPYAYEVERAEFDQVLLDRAKEDGAITYMDWTVREVLFDGDQAVGLKAVNNDTGEQLTVNCPMIVDASGHSSLINRTKGYKHKSVLRTRAAFFSHFEDAYREQGEQEGDIQIVAFRYGWFWMIPFKGNTTSIGAVVNERFLAERAKDEDAEASMWRAINDTPFVANRVKSARQKWPARTIGNYSYGSSSYAGDGYVAIGDAGAFLDPVFSSGVFLTMKSAQLASQGILKAFETKDFSRRHFASYEKRVRAGQKIFLRFIQGWYDPAFLDLFFFPTNFMGIRTAIVTVLAADLFNPKYLWSLKLRIRMMFVFTAIHRLRLRLFRRGKRSLIQQQPI